MGGRRRRTPCEQVGQWISGRLDGELSELESAALERHLEGCGDCRALAGQLESITVLLREARPLEPARRVALPLARRPRRTLVSRAAGAVVLAGAAAAAFAIAISSSSPPEVPTSALGFRSVHEQRQFLHAEQHRLEPHGVVEVYTVAPRVALRSL